jgi:hypothetical protein
VTALAVGPRRLLSQRVVGRALATPVDVVRHLGAMQAQDYGQSLWAVGVRTDRCTLADVERAVEAAEIVRTWPLRGTIHLVAGTDVRWMLELGAARAVAAHRARCAQLGIDDALVARCERLLRAAMHGRGPVRRSELMALLEREGVQTGGQRGYTILWRLAHAAVLCLGPVREKQQTFVLLDEWVPPGRPRARAEALGELASRYFRSRGPATVHDLATWAGLTVADARLGIEAVGTPLARETVDGTDCWLAADMDPMLDRTGCQLLPGFDELLLGYKDRAAVLAPEHAAKVVPGGNGVFHPVVVVDGRVVGTWKRTVARRSLTIALRPFQPAPGLAEQVHDAAHRYGEFIGLPVASVG